MRSVGGPSASLSHEVVREFVTESLAGEAFEGKSVCVIVPDTTRTCPLPLLLTAVRDALAGRAARLTVLVALGTHQPLTADRMAGHVGEAVADDPAVAVLNHEWWDPGTFVTVGTLDAATLAEASEHRIVEDVLVHVNRQVAEHDIALVVGPVFPHEIAGFSGGNKYFFPGISGPEVIDVTHWLAALITNRRIIGVPGVSPVRRLIDRAAALVPGRRLCLALVIGSGAELPSYMAYGTPEDAWEAAAAVSAQVHVRHLDRPVRRVLSLISQRYEDLWTAAKGMYKTEPVVADGGEVVLFAPHVTEASRTHGTHLAKIGYHCRDYFLADMERYAEIPRSVLAHSTHVRGEGTFDPASGEHCRLTVTLASGIDAETTRALGLSYVDPDSIDPAEWDADPDTLVVPNAGEVLYRLRE